MCVCGKVYTFKPGTYNKKRTIESRVQKKSTVGKTCTKPMGAVAIKYKHKTRGAIGGPRLQAYTSLNDFV